MPGCRDTGSPQRWYVGALVRPFATPRGPDDPEVPPAQLHRHLRPGPGQRVQQPGRRPVLSTVVVMPTTRGVITIGDVVAANIPRPGRGVRRRGVRHGDDHVIVTGGSRRRSRIVRACRTLDAARWNSAGSLRVAHRVHGDGHRQQEERQQHSAGHSDRLCTPPCQLLPHTTRMPHDRDHERIDTRSPRLTDSNRLAWAMTGLIVSILSTDRREAGRGLCRRGGCSDQGGCQVGRPARHRDSASPPRCT